jgi:hypothetical protein
MIASTVRYHVSFGTHQTTISVDTMLSELLAIKLTTAPGSKDAMHAVTDWLQELLPCRLGADIGAARGASYWARRYIIEEIADQKLCKQWEAWYLDANP